jgi:hypothetical protein
MWYSAPAAVYFHDLSREAIQGQDQLLQETELTFMSKQF